jgi:Kef-type K+ transport system membrane component KefB
MWIDLLKAALTLVVGFLLQLFFKAIGVEIDPALFNTIVAAIVLWFLTLFGTEATVRGIRGIRNAFKS